MSRGPVLIRFRMILQTQVILSGYTHSLVVFYDSTECMSCALTKIHGWNKLITEYEPKGVNFIFILAPERDETETMSIWFEAEQFIHSVYIDSLQTFIQNNAWINSN